MVDRNERTHSYASASNSNRNEFEDAYDFYLSDIHHETRERDKGDKIRVLYDKSTGMSPAGDFTTVDTDESSQCESEQWDENLIEDPTSYKDSIEELRLESRILLQRSPRKEKLQKELHEVLHRPREDLTILKLLWKDRERIGSMISDLAEAKQTILNLNSQILKQRKKGKQMRNWANKKIDALEERVEMLKAKEKYKAADHIEALRLLNEKLSEANKEAEASDIQTENLQAELTELAKVAKENKELREKLATLKRTSKEYRKQEQDYLSAIQKKAKATQTQWADMINTEENLEKNKQGKRKLNGSSQKGETVVGDIRLTYPTSENNGDQNKIRKKAACPDKPTSHRQRENTQIKNLDKYLQDTNNSLHLMTPASGYQDSDEDDLIRELFFKF